jgi:GNAT superfamily N-acetyltransferase
VVRTSAGKPIGESFFAPLPEGYEFGPWRKPRGKAVVMGDIKLLPGYRDRGLGSEAMPKVVRWVFLWTPRDLFIVPPHRSNPAAYRHRVMQLTRKGLERLGRRGRP